MAEILNLAGIHNDGKSEVTIGIRSNQFVIRRERDSDVVFIVDGKTQKPLSLNNETYSKTEIDNMMTGIMRYVGEYTNYDLLITSITKPVKGMVAYIILAGGTDMNNEEITAHSHILYTGEGWRLI